MKLTTPIRAGLAAAVMVSIVFSTWSVATATSILIFGKKLTAYSAPR